MHRSNSFCVPLYSFINALTKSEQYNYLIKPFSDKHSVIQEIENKCYHYTDFASKKIRIIALDSIDIPVIDNGDGTLKYRVGFYYSQAQLDWLYDTLNSTPSDYAIIILNHGPAVSGYEVGNLSGYDIKALDNTLFADIKNKHNTMNSSSAESLFQKLAKYADENKKAKCFWVQILAKNSFCELWSGEINGKEYNFEIEVPEEFNN